MTYICAFCYAKVWITLNKFVKNVTFNIDVTRQLHIQSRVGGRVQFLVEQKKKEKKEKKEDVNN